MYYQRSSFGFGGGLTPAIKNLIIINAVIFLLSINVGLYNFLVYYFGLIPSQVLGSIKIWQIFTYMFLHESIHSSIMHILFNMFMLWMFGAELESSWGSRQFLKYYLICGIGAGIFILILSPSNSVTIGASGAIFGVMVAFAMLNPDRLLYVYFLFPVKAKYMVGFLMFISYFFIVSGSGGGISHVGHFGGGLVGYLYMKFGHKVPAMWRALKSQSTAKSKKSNLKFKSMDEDKIEYYRKRIDEILDKINRVGYLNLTDEEKKVLEEGSKYLREHDDVDYN
jgi:membrane associated rhomboid family serine protease